MIEKSSRRQLRLAGGLYFIVNERNEKKNVDSWKRAANDSMVDVESDLAAAAKSFEIVSAYATPLGKSRTLHGPLCCVCLFIFQRLGNASRPFCNG